MSRYDAIEDPLCFPGTQVLRNKADLRDQDELDEFEQLMFHSRAEEDLPDGDLNFSHYCAVHRHFFQDVYSWAGQVRTIRTSKGGSMFCYPEHIETEATKLFSKLARKGCLAEVGDEDEFATEAAWFLSELNAIHPFREGNGRSQLVYLTMLARNAGYELHEDNLQPDAFLQAMIDSFNGTLDPLRTQIRSLLD
ncbi:Fic family protein [Martelella lutilitoris]|uniref:protein adenylyltransferase n=1 Tax=Martelella lutilitoris TaxID=2583532 RepID=A0A7T7HNG6_9HYPH|nr:Fic family protein [Martelella lutilitoris]QQM32369.1 Fic family protein [Martelella lutilitoris]